MFDYNNMIQRAIRFFPTWSDIRKRYKKSAGGNYLSANIEEIMNIEDAIEEYKKYYFLDTYEGHEDDIMAFSYKFPVGNIDIKRLTVKYNGMNINVTEDIVSFTNYDMVAYFESGNVYINDKLDPDKITIFVNDNELTAEHSKVSVWNLFDEFACFVGLERHDGELNSQLVKRILYINRYKPNATIEGLQNAIISEILSEVPDITRDEIQIETINDDNLRKAYKNFDTLLDYLNSINCDVYRWKRWDLNTWKHDFKSISYIPAVWDESILNFTNGIGYDDDCKVSMANSSTSTDAVITLYDKSKETMNKYLADKKIEKDISFKLKRYNDILQHNNVNYTIQASPLTSIDPTAVVLDAYQEVHSVSEVSLDSIYGHGHNITVDKSNSIISDHFPYRLKFEAKDNTQEVKISKCTVSYINKITGQIDKHEDLLKEKIGFSVNAFGSLVSTSIKRSITKVEDFDVNGYSFFKNLPNNQGIQAIGAVSTGVKTLYNLGGQKISYSSSCEMSDIYPSSNFISFDSTDCRWDKYNVVFQSANHLKRLHIRLTANSFSFDVLTNNSLDVMVRYSTTGPYDVISTAKYGTTWSTGNFNEPRYMEIVVSTKAEEEIKVGNFKYCKYSVEFYYKTKSNFIKMNTLTLPASNTVSLKVVVNSNSGGNPIIGGIYIGSGIANTVYETDSFNVKNDCYREISIESNCKVTLVKRDVYDSRDIAYYKDYDTSVVYKATENDSYIRLNLNDYSSINNLISNVGQIERIEESGRYYYNLTLTLGQEVKKITVDGNKNESIYSASLLDMINRSMDGYNFNLTTDKVYCSSLVKGVIVLKNRDNGQAELVSLGSKLFAGVSAAKFVFSSIPSNIGVIWGSGEAYYGDSISGSFEYISFYNESDKIHTANNTYNLFISEIKDIPIAENFTEPEYYNKNKLNYYTVKSNTPGVDVRFYNYLDEQKDFNDLKNWSVGIKNLFIKNVNDYNNETLYDINVLDYSNKEVLAEYINLQDSYTLSKNNIINTEQYIILPPEGMSVEYLEYDGTSNTEKLLKEEVIIADATMFKKLLYSNIDKIMYIGKTAQENNEPSEDIKYTLLKDEGIIVWNESVTEGEIIYLKYTIRKPVALVFDLDLLYKLTGYTVETYRELNTYYLPNMNDGETYDLNHYKDFEDSDLAYIQCSEPSFEGQMIDEHTVRFNKHIEEKTIMVKTGYYYFNGREYYLFSEKESKSLYNNRHMLYDNVDISDDYVYTYKATNNYVRNSEMLLRNINDLYTYDCDRHKDLPFNKFTACDSYNDWIPFNTNLILTDELYRARLQTGSSKYEGFNDVALRLIKKDSDIINYAYIDITSYIKEKTFITLAATSELKIYIAEEQKLGDLKLKSALCAAIHTELKPLNSTSIRTTSFTTKEKTKYYLVVVGEGVIDDIIIGGDLVSVSNYHIKNIERLGFDIKEVKSQGSIYKMKLNNLYSSINNKASICSDGYIRTTGSVSWNSTKIKSYSTRDDFTNRNCYKDTELITGDYLKAPKQSSGRFITDYIEISPAVVNRLFIKVNDILIQDMDKFKIKILTTENKSGQDKEVLTKNGSYAFAYGYELYRYVKTEIEIPEGCVIDKIEILVEYKSTKENAPILYTPNTGDLISPVFDAQQSSIYTIKNININDISNINDVEIYIRAMTDNNTSYIWSDWNRLNLTTKNDKVIYDSTNTNNLDFRFTPVRFFQFKIVLKSKKAYIDFESLDIEVKE